MRGTDLADCCSRVSELALDVLRIRSALLGLKARVPDDLMDVVDHVNAIAQGIVSRQCDSKQACAQLRSALAQIECWDCDADIRKSRDQLVLTTSKLKEKFNDVILEIENL